MFKINSGVSILKDQIWGNKIKKKKRTIFLFIQDNIYPYIEIIPITRRSFL